MDVRGRFTANVDRPLTGQSILFGRVLKKGLLQGCLRVALAVYAPPPPISKHPLFVLVWIGFWEAGLHSTQTDQPFESKACLAEAPAVGVRLVRSLDSMCKPSRKTTRVHNQKWRRHILIEGASYGKPKKVRTRRPTAIMRRLQRRWSPCSSCRT